MENKSAVPALVLGLLSTILAFVLGILAPYVPLVLGIIGLIMAVNANKVAKTGMGTAGFVLSIIGVVLSGIYLVIYIACAGLIAQGLSSYLPYY